MADYVTSTPDAEATVMVGSMMRQVLTILGTFGFTFGEISDSKIQIAAGALVTIGSIFWSYWHHKQESNARHAASVQSASGGAAVKPVRNAIGLAKS